MYKASSEADKKTNLKRPRMERVVAVPSFSNDETENANRGKRGRKQNQVLSTDDEIESKLEPLSVPEMDQLVLDPDEISRWEKEEERFTDLSPDCKSKVALEKKALPRSVMESAGKVLYQKPMQPTLASAMSSPSIKPQPAKTRHVFLDREGTPEERQKIDKKIEKTVNRAK
ncbi:hypothetical protein CHS0354_030139 [Potamilus streckersoni]|uniref:Uncharacterized protein n=1 Tax=Potamilus streckersoni TaxID=2493646 RepID=A0AAE0STY6_9BIVA|nr:hypothetical protein CHS0354_030139 [Potamilus streckersoni]